MKKLITIYIGIVLIGILIYSANLFRLNHDFSTYKYQIGDEVHVMSCSSDDIQDYECIMWTGVGQVIKLLPGRKYRITPIKVVLAMFRYNRYTPNYKYPDLLLREKNLKLYKGEEND